MSRARRYIKIEQKSVKNLAATAVVVVTAAIGVYFLTLSHAQSPYASSEAEQGMLGGGASQVTDTGASGGSAVKFGAGSTYTIPSSITADCSVEVSAQLNAFIATVPNGTASAWNTISFPANACYWVDSSIGVGQIPVAHSNSPQNGDHYIYIEGNNATLKAKNLAPAGTRRDELAIDDGSFITVHNLNAVGVNPVASYNGNYEHDANFGVWGAANVTLDDVHGSDAYGDFVDTGPVEFVWPDTDYINNFTLENSTANVTGRMGVTCVVCNGFTVNHNTFSNIGYHVFDLELEDSSWSANNVNFTNNTINQVYDSVVSNAGQSHMVTNVTITGNTQTVPNLTCVSPVFINWGSNTDPLHRPGPYDIENNTFKSLGDPFYIAGADNVTIKNNTKQGPGCSSAAVTAANSIGDVIEGNDFTGEPAVFLPQGNTSNYTVCGNKLYAGGNFDQPAACQ